MARSGPVITALKLAVHFAKDDDFALSFYPGEERLPAMQEQLSRNGAHYDDRCCYKADGVIRAESYEIQLELLILETSNAYNAACERKQNFDFHKAMYGSVAMLKCVADKYRYADYSVFKRLKLYFLHAHGNLKLF